ncbi:MAG TPA: crosslink repair DNA glycosylase YcaQ family protein [Streptosporangiaceae bacterium]|nr:crosslink repair DNA glycosylase YcaQ family protein [Streptosporangiaceae bacterium]
MSRLAAAHSAASPQVTLSADEVRLITLRAQGFIGTDGRRGGVAGMLRRLGAVQLDTISVLARSHELVAYARLGPVPRQRIERAYWHPRRPAAFEYWSHAACVIPVEEWPYYAFRRRALRQRGRRWHESHPGACEKVLARLRDEGPLTATQLGGARGGGAWWDWSETKIAVEWLLDTGEVVCARRTGWRRVYDLPGRVLPGELLASEPSDEECLARLAGIAARALGVVTRADIIDYHRLRAVAEGGTAGQAGFADDAAQAAGLVPVSVEGPGRQPVPAWADPAALAQPSPGRHRVTLLSPFDSLIWDRKRTRRMFGFDHGLEAYVPKARRVHGYYAMPLLARGQLAGRVDPVRRGQTLVARQLSLARPAAAEPMARALREAAEWVGCSAVVAEQVSPPGLAPRLRAALA